MIPSPAFRLARLSFLAAALALPALPAAAETVNIASADDWASFANRVNNGETSLEALLVADVTLGPDAPRVGETEENAWTGAFYGSGHTLTVNWTFGDVSFAAPFAITAGCIIQDLHVAGSITAGGSRAAGFIGWVRPGSRDTEISRCRSSVTITSTCEGEASIGGFVGWTYWASLNLVFRNCLFDGALIGANASHNGGFVGWVFAAPYVYIYNSLFDPARVTMSSSGSATFARTYNSSSVKTYSSYYTQTYGTAQGTAASSMTAEELVAELGGEWIVSNGKATLQRFDKSVVPPSDPEPAVAGFAYQGALNDISGTPLSGTKRIEFRLYDAATGGTPLWGRAHDVLLDGNGLFNVALSDASGDSLEGIEPADPFPALLAASSSSTLYLGLTVAGSEGEIAPRQRLLPVPYASFAADSANASGPFAAAGRLSAGGLAVSGNATVQGNATFKGNLVARTNLTVSGAIRGRDDAHPAPGTVPRGAIVLWKGSSGTIPDGWALCDGSNGTPDLKGRFVVGYDPNDSDYYAVGRTGGETRHRLTTDQIPSHSHNTVVHTVGYSLSHNGDAEAATFDGYKRNNGNRDISGASTGGDQPHENRPPYYALCYIMRIK